MAGPELCKGERTVDDSAKEAQPDKFESHRPVKDRIPELKAENEKLKERVEEIRLELDHEYILKDDKTVEKRIIPPEDRHKQIDGISARNATIGLLEDELKKYTTLRKAIERAVDDINVMVERLDRDIFPIAALTIFLRKIATELGAAKESGG